MISIELQGKFAVVTINLASLDAANADKFKERMRLLGLSRNRVVLDLRDVDFIDSTGVGALISTLKRIREAGGEMSLCASGPRVRGLLQMVRMHRIVDIFNEPAEVFRRYAEEDEDVEELSPVAAHG